jgi:DNA repair protein RadC
MVQRRSAIDKRSPHDLRSMTVRELPPSLQPREILRRDGLKATSPAHLLAIVLRAGVKDVNVLDLAEGLLRHFGSLTALASATPEQLQEFRGIGPVKAQVLAATLELARRLGEESTGERPRVRSPADVLRILSDRVRGLQREVFWVLILDTKHGLMFEPQAVSEGLLDASLVHPREVFMRALFYRCGGVLVAHNHPSGDPTPSAEDIRITRQLVEAGKIVDIRVLDHIILGRPGNADGREYVSLRESGLVEFAS